MNAEMGMHYLTKKSYLSTSADVLQNNFKLKVVLGDILLSFDG